MACPVPTTDGGMAHGMLDFVDCQSLSLGETGYHALAAPGSSLSLALTALFTIFVALIGYRLLLGGQLTLREGVLALVKIGLVLALATGWSSYRILVYDVALRGPAELVNDVGAPAGIPGAGGGLAGRLQTVDDAFAELLQPPPQGTGVAPTNPQPDANGGTAATPIAQPQAQAANAPLRTMSTVDEYSALREARLVLLSSTLGALAVTRLIAGILLAIGPFFIAFLLFDGTRGLFEGWLRVLGGAALGAVGASLILGLELAYIEPILSTALDRRQAILPLGEAPLALLSTTIIFALVLIGVLTGLARLASGLRLPEAWRAAVVSAVGATRREQGASSALDERRSGPEGARSRAAVVVDALDNRRRWDEAHRTPEADARRGLSVGGGGSTADASERSVPLGQSFRRQARARVSAGINRRNAA